MNERALVELVYKDLHRLASSFLRRNRPGHTLQTSALLNEAYLRLAGADSMRFQDRQHYVRVAACAMRQVLVDHARRRSAQKRDSSPMIDLDRPGWIERGKMEEYLTIDASLQKTRQDRSAPGRNHRAPVLRRSLSGGDGAGARHFRKNREARLVGGARLAARRIGTGG
jgi:RNA polymerase sigma factor (TIGR02999 family)